MWPVAPWPPRRMARYGSARRQIRKMRLSRAPRAHSVARAVRPAWRETCWRQVARSSRQTRAQSGAATRRSGAVAGAHVMRNELVEELVPDLVGENGRKLDAALISGDRTSRRGSKRGKT